MENLPMPTRLANLGFAFNPFEHLDASSDPYLHEYLVGHEVFSIAWDESPAFLFAPPGGGKTSMRIYTFRSCWLENGRKNKFPIPYYLPNYFKNSHFESFDDHLSGIVSAGSVTLLLSVAYRPHLFWGLNHTKQLRLFNFINKYVPGDLLYLLGMLEQTGDPATLAKTLDRSFILSEPPTAEIITNLCQDIKKLNYIQSDNDLTPSEQIQLLREIVLSDLGFRSMFILLDGIDGFPDLGLNSTKAVERLVQLFDHSLDLSNEGIMLKAFLPIDTREKLQAKFSYLRNTLVSTLNWDIPTLADVLRRRVFVATRGHFGSLDAVSSIELRDIELALARTTLPLPREVVLIASHLLDIVISRVGIGQNRIEMRDLESAIQWYQDEQISIAATNAQRF